MDRKQGALAQVARASERAWVAEDERLKAMRRAKRLGATYRELAEAAGLELTACWRLLTDKERR